MWDVFSNFLMQCCFITVIWYLVTQKCVFVSIDMWVSVISIYLIHEEANILHVINDHELIV